MTFEQWAKELKAIFAKNGFAEKQMPDFSYKTWGEAHYDGDTPQEAFDTAMSYAD